MNALHGTQLIGRAGIFGGRAQTRTVCASRAASVQEIASNISGADAHPCSRAAPVQSAHAARTAHHPIGVCRRARVHPCSSQNPSSWPQRISYAATILSDANTQANTGLRSRGAAASPLSVVNPEKFAVAFLGRPRRSRLPDPSQAAGSNPFEPARRRWATCHGPRRSPRHGRSGGPASIPGLVAGHGRAPCRGPRSSGRCLGASHSTHRLCIGYGRRCASL